MTSLLFPCFCIGKQTVPDRIYTADGSLTRLLRSNSTEQQALLERKGSTEAEPMRHPSTFIIRYKAVFPARQVACSYKPPWPAHLLGLLSALAQKPRLLISFTLITKSSFSKRYSQLSQKNYLELSAKLREIQVNISEGN